MYLPARPGAIHSLEKAEEPAPGDPKPLPISPDFLDRIVNSDGTAASFQLPDGRSASGTVEMLRRDSKGILLAQGRLSSPEAGFYYFQRQTIPGVAGEMVGIVRFDNNTTAFRSSRSARGALRCWSSAGWTRSCASACLPWGSSPPQTSKSAAPVSGAPAPAETASAEPADPQQAPQTHPTNIPIPTYQNGVIPLQSLPGAQGVIYLDFDGEKGPFAGWGDFDALPSGATNATVKEIWQRVSEDYQGFNINVTTDRKIFDNATPTNRKHIIITPTTNAAPGAGGVAYVGSFNWDGDTVCWCFYSDGKFGAEVCAHEVGHTVGLSHDGHNYPDSRGHEEYSTGQGSGDTGWAPIMGAGYYENLTQWSKGEYLYPSNTEDDLSIITNNNNTVAYRADDYGSTFATAGYLEFRRTTPCRTRESSSSAATSTRSDLPSRRRDRSRSW